MLVVLRIRFRSTSSKYKKKISQVHTSGKTVNSSKNPGTYSGCEFISFLSQLTIPPSPQSSAGTCTANAATAMLIYKTKFNLNLSFQSVGKSIQ